MHSSGQPIAMALLQASRENRLVAYGRSDQLNDNFCCGWFLRFHGERAVFLDVPKDIFGGQEAEVSLDSIEWLTVDSPYLRGLEQLWLIGTPGQAHNGRIYREFEYVETVLREAWENGQVVSIRHKRSASSSRVQVLDVEGDSICVQGLSDDDASSQGVLWCRVADLISVEKDSTECLKVETLLGMPRRVTQTAEC